MGKWEFLSNQASEEEGLGNAGIETFKGAPVLGLARESSQNSLDAATADSNGVPTEVHIIFRCLSIDADEIPGLEDLKKTLSRCLIKAEKNKNRNEQTFFEQALKTAHQPRIDVLSVEDYGTKGLIGPSTAGSPFHALVKSSGVSMKFDPAAGGSFGIGKNAAFAVSNLRTVFYSTRYRTEDSTEHFLAQGKSILISHESDQGQQKLSTGYWGSKDFEPMDAPSAVPSWLHRRQVGTTVASIGFTKRSSWHWEMTECLLRNFFAAIDRKTVRFTLIPKNEESIDINQTTLDCLFERKEVSDAAEEAGTSEELAFSRSMLSALRAQDNIVEEKEFKDVGTFRLTLLEKEELPSRIGILRNSMYITDTLRHFGHSMKRFPLSKEFVAVLEPANRETSSVIRDMENPKHDEISTDRLDDLQRAAKLKSAMRKVGLWVRESIKNATSKPLGPEIILEEMNEFFSGPDAGRKMADPASKVDNPEQTRLSIHTPPPPPKYGNGDQGDSGSSGGMNKSSKKGGRTSGTNPGKGKGTIGGRGGNIIAAHHLRNSKTKDGKTRMVSFTPETSGQAKIELLAIGISTDEPLRISSLDGQAFTRTHRLSLIEGQRVTLAIGLTAAYHGPINLVLTASEGEE